MSNSGTLHLTAAVPEPPPVALDGAQYGAQVSGKIIKKSQLSGLTCENGSGAEGAVLHHIPD